MVLLLSQRLPAGTLLQHVSRIAYRGQPLYFGREGVNRYDSPNQSYSVLYLGFDLATALMESVFHGHRWHRQKSRTIALAEVEARMVRAIGVMSDLTLADLTAPGVMAGHFGLNLAQLSDRRYRHTQRVSEALHDELNESGTPLFDGLIYPSRNNFPATCVALFDRVRDKVGRMDDIDLAEHVDWPRFVAAYRVGVVG